MSSVNALSERADELLARLYAASVDRRAVHAPHAVRIATSSALAALIRAEAAISTLRRRRMFCDIGRGLHHLGSHVQAAESLDIPADELVALADEVRQFADAVCQVVSSPPSDDPSAGV
jgi:hypothetical protein